MLPSADWNLLTSLTAEVKSRRLRTSARELKPATWMELSRGGRDQFFVNEARGEMDQEMVSETEC